MILNFLDASNKYAINCNICHKFKRKSLRPAVCLPLSSRFNEVVSMDLKEFKHNKIWIFHMIDVATRYSMACLIETKRKDVVVMKIFQMWIAYFGAPRKFMFDNVV